MIVKAGFIFCFLIFSTSCLADKPAVMLPEKYQHDVDIQSYWISEKLDGVRARWDGHHLISRGGKILVAPDWFVKDFPVVTLDGELWLARGRYADTWSIVSQKKAHQAWQQIKFMLFDIPEIKGTFSQRLQALQVLEKKNTSVYLQVIPQFRLPDKTALMKKLDEIVAQGGEGLILHHQSARYKSGRSHDILKLKPILFGQATVIGYRAGKGKFTGKVGSLKVQTAKGQIFYVGSGLSNAERANPPPLSATIKFKYQGHTKTGLPRFPIFLEVLNPNYRKP